MRIVVRLALSSVFVVAGLLLPTSSALASCADESVARRVERADVIAYGTLTAIRMTFAPASPIVTFLPERALKGALAGSVEVYFGPTRGGAITSVDYAGAPPERHTLYLRRVDGAYETDACAGSHPGAPTPDEERLAGDAPARAPERDATAVLALVAMVALAAAIAALAWRRRRSA